MSATFADAIQSHVQGEIGKLFTSLPAIVVDIGKLESDNVISVQPAIDRVVDSSFSYKMPIVSDVPVQWPAGGGAVLTFPLAVGDDVLLICTMNSISEWFLIAQGTVIPFDTRTHDLSDSYAIPCIFRKAGNPSPSKNNVVLRYGGKSIALEKNGGDLIISSDTTVIVNGDTTLNGNLTVDGTISATGDISSDQDITGVNVTGSTEVTVGIKPLSTHIHPDPVSGFTGVMV